MKRSMDYLLFGLLGPLGGPFLSKFLDSLAPLCFLAGFILVGVASFEKQSWPMVPVGAGLIGFGFAALFIRIAEILKVLQAEKPLDGR
jgi:hypothetical protein